MEGQNRQLSPKWRIFLQVVVVILLMSLFAGALAIPFVYQSTSLWYKTGFERFLLYGGKIAGLLAACLLFIQILLVAESKARASLFPRKSLIQLHRSNGLLIGGLVLVHPLLVLWSEQFTLLQLEWKYWPEFVGIGLFFLLMFVINTSLFQKSLGLAPRLWRRIHSTAAPGAAVLLVIHVLNVSDSFKSGPPRFSTLSAGAIFLAVWGIHLGKRIFFERRT